MTRLRFGGCMPPFRLNFEQQQKRAKDLLRARPRRRSECTGAELHDLEPAEARRKRSTRDRARAAVRELGGVETSHRRDDA